jgi:hypothetical protein
MGLFVCVKIFGFAAKWGCPNKGRPSPCVLLSKCKACCGDPQAFYHPHAAFSMNHDYDWGKTIFIYTLLR